MIGHPEAHRLLSLELDHEIEPADLVALGDHLAGCADCVDHAERLRTVRQALRGTTLEVVPDVRVGVLAAIASGPSAAPPSAGGSPTPAGRATSTPRTSTPRTPSRAAGAAPWSWVPHRAGRWLPAAACLVVGLLLGSALVGGWGDRPDPAAAQVPERVAAAQFGVSSLSARIEITERGWNGQVPVRTFVGSIDYQAPESLALHLDDTTAYPSDAWVADDVDLVLRDRQWWARGPRDCPSLAQPGCTAPEPRLEVIGRVEPFDDGVAVPLDLVVPVRSFLRSTEPTALGTTTIGGRDAVGVEVTAAQLAPLLDGLRPAGNLRQLFPADPVALWLDATSWTPLRIEVRAADAPDRRTWAANRGYVDRPGDQILTVALGDLRLDEGVDTSWMEPAPEGGVRRDAGFVASGRDEVADRRPVVVDPTSVPGGLVPGTSGMVGGGSGHEAVVQTWAGGRGWLKVTSTTQWDGDRLFGALGSPVRRLEGADGSIRYASLDGTRIGVHADGIDVVVTGSVDEASLLRVAAALDVRGRLVPEGWAEAATETIASATELLPGLLVPSTGLFDAAAVRADGNVVTQGYAGAGSRGFVLVEAPGERLSPPLDLDTSGVVVRGTNGRYSAARGELEWIEGDRVHRLSSSTLSRAELLAVASGLVHA